MDAILDDKQIQNIYDHLGDVLQNTDSVLLYKYVDVEKGTEDAEGVLWLVVDFIMDAVTCVFISVNPEYRGQNIVGRSLAFTEALCREYGLGRVYGVASHPKWAERWGVRQTGQQIMVKEVE